MKRVLLRRVACLLAGLALTAFAGAARGGEKGNGTAAGKFSVNHVGYDMKYVYTWPSSFDMTEMDGTVVQIRFFAFSNQPMEAAVLDLVPDPTADLDLAAKLGAAVISVGLDDKSKVHLFRYARPGAQMFVIHDANAVAATARASGDKWSGKITVTGDEKMHEFDPENVALVQGEITFDVRDTRRPFAGKGLPEDGGEPGRVYLAFNEALLASDRAGILRGLRSIWTNAGEAAGEILLWKDVEMKELALHGGRADARRAVLFGSGNCESYGGQTDFRVFLVREAGGWRIDSFKPGRG